MATNMENNKDIRKVLGVASGGSRWKRRILWIVILAILGVGGRLAWKKLQSPSPASQVQYKFQEATRGDLTVTVTATGQLQPTNTVTVGSEVSGIIDTVDVDYNSAVKAGQVLAKLNLDKLQQQLAQSKASVEVAKAKVADAKVTLEEKEIYYKRVMDARERSKGQLPSQHDVDASKADYDRAKVAVANTQAAEGQAEATLAVDQTNLAKATIKSPVNGVVLSRKVEPGQTIAASFSAPTMFELAEDLSKMKLEVNIDEADVGQVKEGQPVSFTVDAYPGRAFPGRIVQVRYASTTTNNVVTYTAIISVDNKELLLRPGMTATATITVQSVKDALLVPNIALRFLPSTNTGETADQRSLVERIMPGPPPMGNNRPKDDNDPARKGAKVWVLQDQHLVSISVKTGITNGKLTEIIEGDIKPGTSLVVDTIKVSK